jgi:voltage-gated potassium channel
MQQSCRLVLALCLLVALIAGGTVGYVYIEDWSVNDSLYMTMITVTTVGYGEVRELSESGRLFTGFLLLFSIAVAGYSVSTLISFIFEGRIVEILRGRRMNRVLSNLSDHYIICGCGVVGKEVALEFKHSDVPFVIIERDPDKSELGRDESIILVQGDASEEETLTEAGIERAKGLVAALRQDEQNVFVVLTARQMAPELTIVARAAEEKSVNKLIRAGGDRVILPYQIAGRRMASVIHRPTVMNFLDVVVEGGDVAMRLEEVRVGAACDMVGKTLRDSGIGRKTNAIIIGVHGKSGHARVDRTSDRPLSTVMIEEGDVLITLPSEEHLRSLKTYVGGG